MLSRSSFSTTCVKNTAAQIKVHLLKNTAAQFKVCLLKNTAAQLKKHFCSCLLKPFYFCFFTTSHNKTGDHDSLQFLQILKRCIIF